MKKIHREWYLIILVFFSFLTRFWNLSYPPNVVFDEAHFGLYATKYLSGQYYFDVHPPLGKMLYGLVAFFAKIKPGFYFKVDSPYGDFNYLIFRVFSAFFGSFFILLFYFFCKQIKLSSRVAFLSSFFLLFNNALIVESRFILINIFLLFFIFLALFLFFKAQKSTPFSKKWHILNFLTGIFLGVAGSIKLPGFGALILVLFLSFYKKTLSKKEVLLKIAFFGLLPVLVYISVFYLHFRLLPFNCYKDCGEVLDDFLKTCPYCTFFTQIPKSLTFLGKLITVNAWMAITNFSSFKNYTYASGWWEWPLMVRPMPYFIKKISEVKTSYIFMIGNPIAWWLATSGVFLYLGIIVFQEIFRKNILKFPKVLSEILVPGYFIFLIPFVFVKRFTIMYLYFPALAFSTIIFSVLLDSFLQQKFKEPEENHIFYKNKKANLVFIMALILVISGFLFFSPLTYGTPLSKNQYKLRIWDNVLWEIIPTSLTAHYNNE